MSAPVNTVAPVITGTAEVGQVLSVSTGTWTGGVHSYSYQWQRVNSNVENIAGATLNTYVIDGLATDHEIQCLVTATNNTGSTSQVSNRTAVVVDDWFIVEDGTGKSDAISLCSLEDANGYHAHRGNYQWGALTSGARKVLLTKATDYLMQAYRLRWKGSRVSSTQSLDWPRNYVVRDDFDPAQLNGYQMIGGTTYYPNNVVPQEVKNACAELAFKANSTTLLPDLSQLVTREKVDVIEVEYSEYSSQLPRYSAIDYLLQPLLEGSKNSMRVIRT